MSECNENRILIGDMIQTKDSCVFISFKYTGNGALYVLNRIADTQVPDAFNIINEGVYLGVYAPFSFSPSNSHPNEDLTTTFCRVYENVKYTLYVTAVEDGCVHLPLTYTYVADSTAFSPLLPSLRSRGEVERRQQLHLGEPEPCAFSSLLTSRGKRESRRSLSAVWTRYASAQRSIL